MMTLRQLFLGRRHLRVLSLNGCHFGDAAFKVLIDGLEDKPNSEELSLNLSENVITNESIIYITQQILRAGTPEARLSAPPVDPMEDVVNPQRFRVLRLRALDLSNNGLKSMEPSLKELE